MPRDLLPVTSFVCFDRVGNRDAGLIARRLFATGCCTRTRVRPVALSCCHPTACHLRPRCSAAPFTFWLGRPVPPPCCFVLSGPTAVAQRINLTLQQLPDRDFVGSTAFASSGPSLLVLDSGNMVQ